jgi:hypothetical protein
VCSKCTLRFFNGTGISGSFVGDTNEKINSFSEATESMDDVGDSEGVLGQLHFYGLRPLKTVK